jgi:hypothetical protein
VLDRRRQDHKEVSIAQVAVCGRAVGSTRQWVTITLDKFQKKGILSVARQSIVIERYDLLIAQINAD